MRKTLIFLCLVLLTGCDAWNSEASLNRKMIVEVETPSGIKTGSSVVRIWAKKLSQSQAFLAGGNVASVAVRGEAIVLELSKDKYLFALKSQFAGEFYRLKHAWGFTKNRTDEYADNLRAIKKQRGKRVLEKKLYPQFGIFEDINEPSSIKLLKPKDIPKYFGAGYKLKSITMEITDEPITDGAIENALEWVLDRDGIFTTQQYIEIPDYLPKKKIRINNFIDLRWWAEKRRAKEQ